MNEPDLERSLGEWMHEGQSRASSWVLDSVVSQTRQHSNQSPWRRLLGHLLPTLGTDSHNGWARPALANAAIAVALIVAIALIAPRSQPGPDQEPAFVPTLPSPAASAPAPTTVPRPDKGGFDPSGGLVGSLWLEQSDGGPDSYVTLHPDGTVIRVTEMPRHPVGIGVWRPTAERSLTGLVAYADADPVNHTRPGSSTYRIDWVLDDGAAAGSVSWTAEIRPADGSPASGASGRGRLTRLSRLSLPSEATYPAPPEPEWELALGSMVQGPGSGEILAITERCEEGVAPEYLVTHGDGTAFQTSHMTGNGAALWIPTGPDTSALTSWFGVCGAWRISPTVAQLTDSGQVEVLTGTPHEFYGDSPEGFYGAYEASAWIDEPMGDPLPVPDARLWPATGSVWLEETEAGTAIAAHLADGTVIRRDPRFGTGTGYWQPLDADTIASSVGFSAAYHDYHFWSEATTGPDGETMHITYKHQDESGGPVETGSATATRLRIEP